MSLNKIKIHNVWNDQIAHQEVIPFWKSLHALPDTASISKRVEEVVMIAKNGSDQVVGVTTAHEARIKYLNDNSFYNFRAIIHPKYRIPGLLDKLAVETINYLEGLYLEGKSPCIGIITLIENQQLRTRRKEAVYASTGLTFIGFSKKGSPIRVRYFKGAKI